MELADGSGKLPRCVAQRERLLPAHAFDDLREAFTPGLGFVCLLGSASVQDHAAVVLILLDGRSALANEAGVRFFHQVVPPLVHFAEVRLGDVGGGIGEEARLPDDGHAEHVVLLRVAVQDAELDEQESDFVAGDGAVPVVDRGRRVDRAAAGASSVDVLALEVGIG